MRRKPARWAIVVTVGALLCACNGPIPGSENVRLLKDVSQVQGAQSVGTLKGTTDQDGVHKLSVKAKNFAYKHDADIVTVRLQPMSPSKIDYTIEAWKTKGAGK